MEWSYLSDPGAVQQAVAEFDEYCREAFLTRCGCGRAKHQFLRCEGRYDDSKAIAGVACGCQSPDVTALTVDVFGEISEIASHLHERRTVRPLSVIV